MEGGLSDKEFRAKWLKIKKTPGIRVGNDFQASIPQFTVKPETETETEEDDTKIFKIEKGTAENPAENQVEVSKLHPKVKKQKIVENHKGEVGLDGEPTEEAEEEEDEEEEDN
eukprot:CAMPEP_0114983394 /NCGR_PEP_ID=MMETSP0216-20121206/6669_1 /TAXON_ID=223996 /ORGANISM="Protocruzia adherens, Strain Boccale" /LENGTH=112 /DNA_ID=CAMNT_0002345359 /DNA_START=12 /DNA_END=350 /DNA_ORIENTATION=-